MILSTTGQSASIQIQGLRWTNNEDLTLIHPVDSFDVFEFFSEDEVEGAMSSIQSLVSGGDLRVQTYSGDQVLDVTELAEMLSKAEVRALIPAPVVQLRTSRFGEMIPCYFDPGRNKWLSVQELAIIFTEARVGDNDHFQLGATSDSQTGYPVEREKMCITASEYSCEDGSVGGSSSTKALELHLGEVFERVLFNSHNNGLVQGKLVNLNIAVEPPSCLQIVSDNQSIDLGDTVVVLYCRYDLT